MMSRPMWAFPSRTATVAAFVLLAGAACAASPELPVPIRFGVSTSILMNVSRTDAQVAFQVWLKEIGREMGKTVDIQVHLIDKSDVMADAVRRNDLDYMLLPTLDYLRFRQEQLPLEPSRVAVVARGSLDHDVLLARRDSGMSAITDLAGKRVILQSGGVGSLSQLWLDVLLLREGRPDARRFFGEVRQTERISHIILPVFFRQADAGVARETNFATLQDMNPQLGRELAAVARSPQLLFGITCFHAQIAPEPRQIISDGLARLNRSSAGKQILTLFKVAQLVPFDPAHIEGTLRLVREHATLLARRGG